MTAETFAVPVPPPFWRARWPLLAGYLFVVAVTGLSAALYWRSGNHDAAVGWAVAVVWLLMSLLVEVEAYTARRRAAAWKAIANELHRREVTP